VPRGHRNNPGLYQDAQIYDILHAPGTAAEVRALERILARHLPGARSSRAGSVRHARPPRLTLLEPACGTGRYLRLLARRGHRVIGFDREPAMIDYARSRLAPSARTGPAHVLTVADMTHFADTVPCRVDAAFNLINTIRHLGSDAALLAHLDQVRRILHPGGVYIVGISLTAYGLEFPTEDVWCGARGRTMVSQIVQYEPPEAGSRRERVYSHLHIRRGRREEHRDSAYGLRTYDDAQWRACLRRARFAVRETADARGHTRHPTASGYAIWVLTPASDGPTRSDGRARPARAPGA
jgi:SAM-dependent methyltransferase